MSLIDLQNSRIRIVQRKNSGGGGGFTYAFAPTDYTAANDGDFVETILTTTNPADPATYLVNSDGAVVNFTTFQIDATNWAIDCNIDAGGPVFPATVTLKTPDNTTFTIHMTPLLGLLLATITGIASGTPNCPPNGSVNVTAGPGNPLSIQGFVSSNYDSTPNVSGGNFNDPMIRIGKSCTTVGNADITPGNTVQVVISDGVGHTFTFNILSV